MQAEQQATYPNQDDLDRAVADLSRLPPIVTSWEVDALKDNIAKAQRGEAFVLQGGDCAETFDECTSENIVEKLKILLQMSLVMLYGLKMPVIRVGRMAGQYAKPRSADTETRDGVSLPSFRGDLVNRNPFTADDRIPDPQMILRGYERAALTLNFVRSLIDGGFADLHHPENWDLILSIFLKRFPGSNCTRRSGPIFLRRMKDCICSTSNHKHDISIAVNVGIT